MQGKLRDLAPTQQQSELLSTCFVPGTTLRSLPGLTECSRDAYEMGTTVTLPSLQRKLRHRAVSEDRGGFTSPVSLTVKVKKPPPWGAKTPGCPWLPYDKARQGCSELPFCLVNDSLNSCAHRAITTKGLLTKCAYFLPQGP